MSSSYLRALRSVRTYSTRTFRRMRPVWMLLLISALIVTTSQRLLAQCVYDVNLFQHTCAGNLGTITLDMSLINYSFVDFLDGVTGQVTLISSATDHEVIDFSTSATAVTVDLSNQTAFQTIYPGLDVWFQEFSHTWIYATEFNDILTGSAGDDNLVGAGGDDLINGGDGNDMVGGGDDNDTINGGAGDDLIYAEGGNNIVNGNEGNDILIGGGGDDVLNGNAGNDRLSGEEGTDTIDGGADTDAVGYLYDISECSGDTLTNVEVNTCMLSTPPVVVDPPSAPDPELCITRGTRVSVDSGKLLIFGDFGDHNPNGMTITHIPLSSLRNPTDDEKAANALVWLTYKDSEFAPGWAAAVYWQSNHYGVVVYNGGNVVDDTGPICGWF